jgi:hypothetical protein
MQNMFNSTKQKLYKLKLHRNKKILDDYNLDGIDGIDCVDDVHDLYKKFDSLSTAEMRIQRNINTANSFDYLEIDDIDIWEDIGNLPIKLYSIYMNFELNLMTKRQLSEWLAIYLPKYCSIILNDTDKFFIENYMYKNIREPTQQMLKLIDFADHKEQIFLSAFRDKDENKCIDTRSSYSSTSNLLRETIDLLSDTYDPSLETDNKFREKQYEKIKKKEEDMFIIKTVIKF